MAEIVLGIGTSHAPQLVTSVEDWRLRVPADRSNAVHYYRGDTYTFDELVRLRSGDGIEAHLTDSAQHAHAARNQAALDVLAAELAAARVDVAVIVGNDQNECFSPENVAAFSVYCGETFEGIPKTPAQIATLPSGIAPTARGYLPPERTVYRGAPQLANHIIEALMAAEFDPGQTTRLPVGPQGTNSIQHAFGFVFRRLMHDQAVPALPIYVNTHYPPNRPGPARCLAFGAALAAAITSWPQQARVALIASGGLTHYVIDEIFDQHVLDAMRRGDLAALGAIDERRLEAGTAELKNWLPVAGAMTALGKTMNVIDYVPCYRSEAGTGTAMGFASWS
jgi:hypothetical protein